MKTIVEMAHEAGLPGAWISETGVLKWSDLKRFAALVRADEREAQRTVEANFCPRCGKRLASGFVEISIHTCTPPKGKT